jgi:hypothetical protein
MRLFGDIDLEHRPFGSPEEAKQYADWSTWAKDLGHLRRIAHATEQDVEDELAAIAAMSHEEAGNCIDFLCYALVPVVGGGFELPESGSPTLRFEPEWHELGLTRMEVERIGDLLDVFRHQAERTETPGYDPDNPGEDS